MAKIEGLQKVVDALRARAAKARQDDRVSVAVGYTAAYALWIHERREMRWRGFPRDRSVRRGTGENSAIAFTGYSASERKGVFWGPHGRAGYLLDVAREMNHQLGAMVVTALQKKKTMAQALVTAGLALQRESQKNVPVEFGFLRASAFTALEK